MQVPLLLRQVNKIFYTETQNMQRIWLWVIGLDLIICGSILMVVSYNNETNIFYMLPAIILMLAAFAFVLWIFLCSRLIITIDSEGIHYSYPVFKPKWKKILKDDIKIYTIQNYDAIFDYGGWGVKKSKKKGMCITIQGDTGILLVMKNGEQILIGTLNKEGIEWGMKRLMQVPAETQ